MLQTLSFTSPMAASAQMLCGERPSAEDRDLAPTTRKNVLESSAGGCQDTKLWLLELPPLSASMATAVSPAAPAVEMHKTEVLQVWSLWAEFHIVIASLYEHMPGTSSRMHNQLKKSFFQAANTSKAVLKVFLEQFVKAGRLRCVYACMHACLC